MLKKLKVESQSNEMGTGEVEIEKEFDE